MLPDQENICRCYSGLYSGLTKQPMGESVDAGPENGKPSTAKYVTCLLSIVVEICSKNNPFFAAGSREDPAHCYDWGYEFNIVRFPKKSAGLDIGRGLNVCYYYKFGELICCHETTVINNLSSYPRRSNIILSHGLLLEELEVCNTNFERYNLV